MKTHTLEAGQFIEFINPWKEWNTEWNDVNCGNTNEMSLWVFTAMVTYSFHLYSRSSHHFILYNRSYCTNVKTLTKIMYSSANYKRHGGLVQVLVSHSAIMFVSFHSQISGSQFSPKGKVPPYSPPPPPPHGRLLKMLKGRGSVAVLL